MFKKYIKYLYNINLLLLKLKFMSSWRFGNDCILISCQLESQGIDDLRLHTLIYTHCTARRLALAVKDLTDLTDSLSKNELHCKFRNQVLF